MGTFHKKQSLATAVPNTKIHPQSSHTALITTISVAAIRFGAHKQQYIIAKQMKETLSQTTIITHNRRFQAPRHSCNTPACARVRARTWSVASLSAPASSRSRTQSARPL